MSETMTETEPMTDLVAVSGAEFGLPEAEASHVAAVFTPILAQLTEIEPVFQELTSAAAEGITPELSKEARDLRLRYVRIRTATERAHKDAKAYYLAGGRYVDAWKNAEGRVSAAREESLAGIEEHFERIERERIAALEITRQEQLAPYGSTIPGVGSMPDETFEALLTGVKAQHEAKIEAARKAEAERIEAGRAAEKARAEAAAKAEAERRAEIEREREARRIADEENARLRAEQLKAQAEAREREAEIARERAAAAAKLRAEREKAEAEFRKAQEKAEAERRKQAAEIARLRAEQEAEAERIRVEQERRDADARVKVEQGEAGRFADFVEMLQDVLSRYTFETSRHQRVHAAVSQIVDRVMQSRVAA